MRLMVELTTGAEPQSGMSLAIKRTLEHLVAVKVLEAIAGPGDMEFADTLGAQRLAALGSLRNTLDSMESIPSAVTGYRF